MLSGCTMCSASACGMSSCSWLNVALSSPMRRFGAGARNSAGALPAACAADGHGPGTSGTWTRCSSGVQGVQHHLCRHGDRRPGVFHHLPERNRVRLRPAKVHRGVWKAATLTAFGAAFRRGSRCRRRLEEFAVLAGYVVAVGGDRPLGRSKPRQGIRRVISAATAGRARPCSRSRSVRRVPRRNHR